MCLRFSGDLRCNADAPPIAAAMVELMAEEKLHFRVEVPEQLVVLDPSMQSKDENYVRILQR